MAGDKKRDEIIAAKTGKARTAKVPQPGYLEKAGNLETLVDITFRIFLRLCQSLGLAGLLVLFAYLFFQPDKLRKIIEVLAPLIGANTGLTIPVLLLGLFGARAAKHFVSK